MRDVNEKAGVYGEIIANIDNPAAAAAAARSIAGGNWLKVPVLTFAGMEEWLTALHM